MTVATMSTKKETVHSSTSVANEDLFQWIEALGVRDLHFKQDPETGLNAIVAIHSVKSGSSLGGCRYVEYPSTRAAIMDAMRLARGMTYKSGICNLNYGGGKAVIIKPKKVKDHEALFKSFAKFVHDLGGRYITAKDSGTTVEDMDLMATITPYVACTSTQSANTDDPSFYTAYGMLKGIEACVQYQLGRSDLEGLHVAIQGVGSVGYDLAKFLHERGVRLTVTDVDLKPLQKCQQEFNAQVVLPEDIYKTSCDIFSPCALGATLNEKTIPLLNASIVAGSANNQLAQESHDALLKERGILYAPDFAINSGGLIQAVAMYRKENVEKIMSNIEVIYHRLLEIFERSEKENRPTNEIAIDIAKENTRDPEA